MDRAATASSMSRDFPLLSTLIDSNSYRQVLDRHDQELEQAYGRKRLMSAVLTGGSQKRLNRRATDRKNKKDAAAHGPDWHALVQEAVRSTPTVTTVHAPNQSAPSSLGSRSLAGAGVLTRQAYAIHSRPPDGPEPEDNQPRAGPIRYLLRLLLSFRHPTQEQADQEETSRTRQASETSKYQNQRKRSKSLTSRLSSLSSSDAASSWVTDLEALSDERPAERRTRLFAFVRRGNLDKKRDRSKSSKEDSVYEPRAEATRSMPDLPPRAEQRSSYEAYQSHWVLPDEVASWKRFVKKKK